MTPDETIYSASGRRVGVIPPPQSLLNFSPVRSESGGATEEEGTVAAELSKVNMEIDLEDKPVVTSTNNLTMFDGQNFDLGISYENLTRLDGERNRK
jgi:hypothetical protein